jgi:hypothetical protein
MSAFKKNILRAKIAVYLLVPAILLLLPADFFDEGQSVCVSKVLLDIECYGCGITRAIMHLIHFDFQEAYSYNKLSLIVFPLLAYIWASSFYQDLRKLRAI